MPQPVPYRVGSAVTCELNALRDNNELEITPEDAGALTPPVLKQVAAQEWRACHVVTVEQSVALRMSCLYSMTGCSR